MQQELPAPLSASIAERIGVVDPKQQERFHRYLSGVVKEAWRGHAVSRKMPRQGDVTRHLDRLLADLNALLPEAKGEPAGVMLAAVIAPHTIEDWIVKVERARFNTTENPSTRLRTRGALPGTRGNPAFDLFLAGILTAEGIFKFKWTIGWNNYDQCVKGSLVDTLDTLEECLPPNFIPEAATLRRSVSRMRCQLSANNS